MYNNTYRKIYIKTLNFVKNMKTLKKKLRNKTKTESEEDIKIKLNSKRKNAIFILSTLVLAGLVGTYFVLEFAASQNRIILATTTSTYDSGLLDYLLPTFEEKYGITVDIISVGTGQALEAGKRGDADVLLVHAREKEDDFVEDGYGIHRVCVMYNDFIIIGPPSDLADIEDENVIAAMEKLNDAGERGVIEFYSRGDNSGTNTKELELWDEIDFEPDADDDEWYKETGSGMGDTLTITNDNEGYTLIDRGMWLAQRNKVDLIELVSIDEILLNPYGAIAINPEKIPAIKYEYAIEFIAFLVSEKGQKLISDFRKKGEKLFKPCFGKCDETHSCDTTEDEVDFWKKHNGGYKGT